MGGSRWAREVAFYQVAATMADHLPMLTTCYGSSYDDERGDSRLLLRDVSATHISPVTREQLIAGSSVPPDDQLAAVVEALAGLHAAWWEHPALGIGKLPVSEWYRDQACFEASLREFTDNWGAFQQMTGETLSTATRALGNEALAALPYLWQQHLAERMSARANSPSATATAT